ncbi:MAG TPA: HD domain-containing protein [Roseiarcus sp.]|nr:HD domain-containing protein [Roseiarcus sp.]
MPLTTRFDDAAPVIEHGGDENQAIAALLHDGPEDRGGRKTLLEIERRFGLDVARIVEDCTTLGSSRNPNGGIARRLTSRICRINPAGQEACRAVDPAGRLPVTPDCDAAHLAIECLDDKQSRIVLRESHAIGEVHRPTRAHPSPWRGRNATRRGHACRHRSYQRRRGQFRAASTTG